MKSTILIALACALLHLGTGDSPTAHRATSTVMEGLGREFRAAETALRTEDLDGARRAIQSLIDGARQLGSIQVASQASIATHGQRIETLATEILGDLAPAKLPLARTAFGDLRNACVSCHARADQAPIFPAVGGTVVGRLMVHKADGTLRASQADVFVHVAGASAESRPSLPRKNPAISQQGRRFSPRVLPVLRRTTVDFPNDDTIYHNVFSLSDVAKFDLGIYDPGKRVSITFDKPGIVPIFCNIHPEMRCTVIVVDNPYFGLTDDDGTFVITGVPDGNYQLHTWNEYGAVSSDEIEVKSGRRTTVSRDIRETRAMVSHPNKYGKPYDDKYR